MEFVVRFDFRNPPFAGTTMAERYAASLEMAAWADRLGARDIWVLEHHGTPDGYMPSPLTLIAAFAAATRRVQLKATALIAPFYEPLRLAEELCVLDHLSQGRFSFMLGAGYVHEEFEMFGVPMAERPKRMTEVVETLQGAFSGKPFEYRGRTVHVTPSPLQAGGPHLIMGGSSEGAARRAARLGVDFYPTTTDFWPYYVDELAKLGRPDPGPCPRGKTMLTTLATDVDEAWERLSPYFLYDTNAYGDWREQDDLASPFRSSGDIEEVKSGGVYRIVTPDELLAEIETGEAGEVMFHPMCGGIPPALAWEGLRLFEHEVLPRLKPNENGGSR